MTDEEVKAAANEWVVKKIRDHFCNEDQQDLSDEDIINEFQDEWGLAMDAYMMGFTLGIIA